MEGIAIFFVTPRRHSHQVIPHDVKSSKRAFTYDPSICCHGCDRGDDQARDFRGKTPADVIGEAVELPEGVEPDEELCEVIRRTLAGGMDLAQDAVQAADEVCGRNEQ